MTQAQLKNKIISKINSIEDEDILNTVYEIIDNATNEKIYHLSPEQINVINEAREEYKRGEYSSNEDVNDEIEKWLEE